MGGTYLLRGEAVGTRDEGGLLLKKCCRVGVSLLLGASAAAAQANPGSPAQPIGSAQPSAQIAAPASPNPNPPAPNVTVPAGLGGMQGLKVASIELHSNVQLPPERLQQLVAQ